MTTIAMRRILVSWLTLVVFWLGAAVPATAQTITVTGCASLTSAGGTGIPNLTITCNPAGGGYIGGPITGANVDAYVESVYQLLFGRAADAAGKAFYVTGFKNGAFTAKTIAVSILDGARGADAGGVGNNSPPTCSALSITPVPNVAEPTSLTLNATCTPGSKPITSITAAGALLTTGLPTAAPYVVNVASIAVPTQTAKYAVTASDGTTTVTAEVSYTPLSGGNVAKSCAAQGFSKTIWYDWDWTSPVSRLDTAYMADAAGGAGLGTNGILVVAFRATPPLDNNILAAFSATGYPAPNMANALTLAISTQPCQLNAEAPASATDHSPTVAFGVGAVPQYWATGRPAAVALTPGTQYYINVAGRNSVSDALPFGTQTCVPGINYPYCEIRLGLSKPTGH